MTGSDYVPKATGGFSHRPRQIEERKGVCQDFAHIMIALARAEDSSPLRQRLSLSGARQNWTARSKVSHAWVEALLPGSGNWTGSRASPTIWKPATGKACTPWAAIMPMYPRYAASSRGTTRRANSSAMVHVALSDAPVPEQEPGGVREWQDVQEVDPVDVQQQQQQ